MLVLFSDIHLTDGSSGETISEEAFDVFADRVARLALRRRAEEVRIVLLGDGLDVIRSSRWLDSPEGLRPWSPAGPAQEKLTLDILKAILRRNSAALEHLRRLPARVAAVSRVPLHRVRLEYVLGNHDWIINRYRSARAVAAAALNLPTDYVDRGFPLEFTSGPDAYDCVARHGDCYDNLNFDFALGRDAASLGDGVVVELLNRFPREVLRELGPAGCTDELHYHLNEIDNVRPYPLISLWVRETVRRLGRDEPRLAAAARRALDRCVADFVASPAIADLAARHLSGLQRLYLRVLLNRIRRRRISVLDAITRFGERILRGWRVLRNQPECQYTEHALAERLPGDHAPRFVVYGHTHDVATVPLGLDAGGAYERFYLNTGTWRSVWEVASSAPADRHAHFSSWKVMNYVVIYSAREGHGRHEFEMWGGQLRDRPGIAAHDDFADDPIAAATRSLPAPVASEPEPAIPALVGAADSDAEPSPLTSWAAVDQWLNDSVTPTLRNHRFAGPLERSAVAAAIPDDRRPPFYSEPPRPRHLPPRTP